MLSVFFGLPVFVEEPKIKTGSGQTLTEISSEVIPETTAESFLIADLDSGEIILEKKSMEPHAMASLTKLMTVLVSLENYKLTEACTISKAATKIEGAKVGYKAHDALSVKDLIHGALIRSGNDAAVALAEHFKDGESAYIDEMNQKAIELGMYGTHFENVMGLDSPNHYTTARDLLTLSQTLIKEFPEVLTIASTQKEISTSFSGFPYELKTTNELLGTFFMNVLGLKTGTTDNAGQSYIGIVQNKEGHKYIVILLGSIDRFPEAKTALYWIVNGKDAGAFEHVSEEEWEGSLVGKKN